MNLLNEIKRSCVVSFFPIIGEFDATLYRFEGEVTMTESRSTDFVKRLFAAIGVRRWFDSDEVRVVCRDQLGRTVFLRADSRQLFLDLEEHSPVFYEVTDTLRYWAECGLNDVVFRFRLLR